MKQQWNVIGLMSGTSLDGIDLVYTSIFKENGEYSYQILNSKTIPYPKKVGRHFAKCFLFFRI